MSQQIVGAVCPRCNQMRLFVRTRAQTNHIMHILLTCFLCGLWLPVWMMLLLFDAFTSPPWRCIACEGRPGKPPSLAALVFAAFGYLYRRPSMLVLAIVWWLAVLIGIVVLTSQR